MDENVLKVLHGQQKLIQTAASKTLVLEILCGIVLADIAYSKPDPQAHMAQLSATLLGFIEQFAHHGDPALTESVETVLRYAEKLVAGPGDAPRTAV